MELEIDNAIESVVVLDDSFKEKIQQPEALEMHAQSPEAETNGYTGNHDTYTELEACESLTHSSAVPTTDSADAKITCLEDELKKTRSELELLAMQHESELKLAQDKTDNAEMRLIVTQEGTAVRIKEADEKISFLENELLKVQGDLASAAADQLKLRSVEGESAILAEELLTSQSKLSELEGKSELADQQVQQLITEVESLMEKVSISEGLLAAAEAKTKETEERLALEVGFHQEEMALKEDNLRELKEKVEAELETFRKGKLDVENDLKLALEKADKHWEQLMLKEQLGNESLDRLIELQNTVEREKAMVSDAEQTIFSLKCEIDELKGQIAAGAEREAVFREAEIEFAKLKQDYDSAQGNCMEVVAKLQSAEIKSEEQFHRLEAYEENAIRAGEKVSELERMLNISEDKLKSTEELVGTLHAELHDLKLSGATDAELLKETKLKSAQLEEELQSKLKASEERCQDLDISVSHLTEMSCKLEESLDALQTVAKSGDMKIRELEIEIKNLQQFKEELEEKLRVSGESLSHHETSANQSLERAIELDNLITKHQTEANDATNRAAELDVTLLKVQERNSELEFLLKSAEDKLIELEREAKQLTGRASELEEYVKVLKSEANNAMVHADELELSLTNSSQMEKELLERLQITEGRFLEQENDAKSSTARVAELDELIAGMDTEMNSLKARISELKLELGSVNDALAKANELDATLLKVQERNSELEFLFKSAEVKSIELEIEVKQFTERASELEEYVKVLKSETNNATAHADELELSLIDSRQREKELLERLEITEERFLEQENTGKISTARVAELDELIAGTETEINSLKSRVSELELELGSANNAMAKANELELALVNSREKEQELLKRLEVAEERLLQQESTSKCYMDRVTELDELIATLKFELNNSRARASDLELELGNAKQEVAVLEENLKHSEAKLTVMEDSVTQLTSRSDELEHLLEVANAQAKDATDMVTATELVLLAEQQKCKQVEAVARDLDDSLCQLKEQIFHLETELKERTTKHSEAESMISELRPLVDKLESAENLATSLNERICAAEDRASKAETDLHTSILSESKLRDEISSHQVVITNLRTSSSETESEKQELADQIGIAIRRSSELSEQLMQETKRHKETEMLVSTLNDNITAAEEKANKSEADALAAVLSESNLRDELASHQTLIRNLQVSLVEAESEKQILGDQINITTMKFNDLNEHLVQERQHLQEAGMLTNTLNEMIASAEERANKSEADLCAAILSENKLNAELSSFQILINNLQTSLSQVENEKQSLTCQIDSATRSLSELNEQLMQEMQQLQAAELLASLLNEKISAAEDRANKVEADAQAAVLSESKLRDELSSHKILIGTLQASLSQVESEKEALATQIDGATQSFNELNEKLMQERQQLQLQMATMMQENRDLTGKVASLQAEVREALSEIEASAAQIQEVSLTEVSLDRELQIQKSQLVKTSDDCVYIAEPQHKLEHAVSMDEHQVQLDQLVVTTKSLINRLAIAEEEKEKLRMENGTLQKAVQNKENLVEELKCEGENLHATDEPDAGSMGSRDFDMDFTGSPVTIRRRKGAEATSVAGENLASVMNANGKPKHPESPVVRSQLLFSLCVISMVSLFSGFWIARKVYL